MLTDQIITVYVTEIVNDTSSMIKSRVFHLLLNFFVSVADPEFSKGGGGTPERGAHSPQQQKNHVFWVSNLEFY
jgi:hypothetical protein